ncbi:MAG: hypothetical protein CMG71_00645 [Candidatus Marinimicrobia bacterium]|nr:hypothetical protein [Candidatus Neomarinimicrobiota bacterium]|tara:strand:+ start:7546 stop:7899 length:354 start_codon:yes stop_codon:yes gene_type:complete
MMKIENTVNDVVLVVLNDVTPFERVGIGIDQFYARVVGYDEFGIWLEHPNFEVVMSEDEMGQPLPPDKVTREQYNASVYIPWRNVASLVHFPNRDGFDFPSPFDRNVGFRTEEESKD